MTKEIKSFLRYWTPFNDEMVINKNLKTNYVSTGIGEDYKKWIPENPVFISAQTGYGKNYFIENIIIKNTIETTKKILIISNRLCTNRQEKIRICKLTSCEDYLEDYTPKGLDKVERFKNVRLVTYQKLEAYLNDPLKLNEFSQYDIVIQDEVHYYILDSPFNNKTYKTLKKSIEVFKNSIRIYMTSTPSEVFSSILSEEKKLNYNYNYIISSILNQPIDPYLFRRKFLYYNFKRNYDYILPRYFASKEELLDLINNDSSPYKWLIFINSRATAQKFKEKINTNSTVFISSESKNSKDLDGKTYNEIINLEKFSCKILLTTSVLDNGINLKDKLLKNIVIFSYDKTEFIQILGRKRILDNEKVNLFLYSGKVNELNTKLSIIKKQLKIIEEFKNDSSTFLNKYFNNSEVHPGLFYFNRNSKPILNPLAEKKLWCNKSFYEEIISQLNAGNKQAFILEQLSWLDLKKSYNPSLYITYVNSDTKIANFIKFLNSYCDTSLHLPSKEFDNFCEEFKLLATAAYGKQPNDRKDRPYKEIKMRKIFNTYNLNYEIKIKNEVFTLSKKIQ
jgi:hypothetical protein